MNIYFYIALLSVLVKAYLWFKSQKYHWADRTWYVLMAAFLLQNLTEMTGYHQISNEIEPMQLLRTYYVTLIFLLWAIFRQVHDGRIAWQNFISGILLGFFLLFSGLVLYSDLIIAGYTPSSFPVEAVKGDYFDLYLLFGLSVVILSFGCILSNIIGRADSNSRRQNIYHLLSLSPFFLIASAIGVGMLLGFPVNGSGFLPVGSTLFVMITVTLRCTPDYVVDSLTPFSQERGLSQKSGLQMLKAAQGTVPLKEVLDSQERLLIAYAVEKYGRNKSLISQQLGVERRTLDRKLKKYELWWRG